MAERAEDLLCGLIRDRSGENFEALSQRRKSYSITEKIAIAVCETRARQRRQPLRRRHVAARRIEGRHAALLLLAQDPGQEKLCGIGMWRIFQDAACGKEDRRLVFLRHHELQVATADARTIANIEADEIGARSHASRDIAMALDEI